VAHEKKHKNSVSTTDDNKKFINKAQVTRISEGEIITLGYGLSTKIIWIHSVHKMYINIIYLVSVISKCTTNH